MSKAPPYCLYFFKNKFMLNWVEIKKSAIQYNLRQFRKIVGQQRKIMAIVKANAYGHGMLAAANIAIETGVDYLGVVNLTEALSLRQEKIKAPIFILSYYPLSSQIKQAIKSKIDFPVYTFNQAKFLSKTAQGVNKEVNIHIKIDTGTSRIGIFPSEAVDFIKKINKLPNLNLRGIFTHYAESESQNQAYTDLQTQKFQKIVKDMSVPLVHAGCSASTINNPKTLFNLVRIGIGMYGLWPSSDTKRLARKNKIKFNLKSALSWKTKIIQVKALDKGAFISYDRTYQTEKRTKIAVLPVGYWDGYDRKLSGCGTVLIGGHLCPVRGLVCMNLTMVDVSKVRNVREGDEVVLLGRQKKQIITAEDLAKKIGTINYEVVTRINPLVPRYYL